MRYFFDEQGRTRVFARLSRCCGEAYFSTSPRQIHAGQEGGNPRPPARRAYASERERRSSERTPLIVKIAIYGWKLIEDVFIIFVIAFISCRPAGITHSRLNAKFGQDIELQKEIATD
ncbi:MAG: hypothetical protein JRJ46_09900 [Deltaproteobacteria bacterium]|nr:hypothetical protein [Deltaproteobacteria bacterium]